jgi:hypothetical protein
MFILDIPGEGRWTVDFSSMRAHESTAGSVMVVLNVKDGMPPPFFFRTSCPPFFFERQGWYALFFSSTSRIV